MPIMLENVVGRMYNIAEYIDEKVLMIFELIHDTHGERKYSEVPCLNSASRGFNAMD